VASEEFEGDSGRGNDGENRELANERQLAGSGDEGESDRKSLEKKKKIETKQIRQARDYQIIYEL
jgi:hypothetical protein